MSSYLIFISNYISKLSVIPFNVKFHVARYTFAELKKCLHVARSVYQDMWTIRIAPESSLIAYSCQYPHRGAFFSIVDTISQRFPVIKWCFCLNGILWVVHFRHVCWCHWNIPPSYLPISISSLIAFPLFGHLLPLFPWSPLKCLYSLILFWVVNCFLSVINCTFLYYI